MAGAFKMEGFWWSGRRQCDHRECWAWCLVRISDNCVGRRRWEEIELAFMAGALAQPDAFDDVYEVALDAGVRLRRLWRAGGIDVAIARVALPAVEPVLAGSWQEFSDVVAHLARAKY